MNPILCNNCGKKIGEVKMTQGIVSVKCNKCGTINTVESKIEKQTEGLRTPLGTAQKN